MVSNVIKNSNQKILTDKKCPNCGKSETKIHGNELIHSKRVCLSCGRVFD